MVKVLFVCLGNICRSPTAEGVFRKYVVEAGLSESIHIDSAGTHAYHIDEPPDRRAQETAARRGIDISGLRGRRATETDLDEFDYVLAMDRENLHNLLAISQDHQRERIKLFLEFAKELDEQEVPDPYYGGPSGFDRVMDMIEEASEGLLADIRQRHGL
ncbi:MAG: low molecular weight protein-tyrosine-phosphatase [Acidiferrobacterales bacterium]